MHHWHDMEVCQVWVIIIPVKMYKGMSTWVCLVEHHKTVAKA